MDANGHRFWMLAEASDFDLSDGSCQWSGNCLHLSGKLRSPEALGSRQDAEEASNLPPVTVGHFDDWACFDPDQELGGQPAAIVGATMGHDLRPLLGVPARSRIRDMVVDAEGLLRTAGRFGPDLTGVSILDLRGRWQEPVLIETPGVEPDRIAGQWVLHRASGRLWREKGAGLPDLAQRTYADHIFRPEPEYTDPIRLLELDPIDRGHGEGILDCAVTEDGTLVVLIVSSVPKKESYVEFVPAKGARIRMTVPFPGFASSIGVTRGGKIALTYPGAREVFVFDTGESEVLALSLEPNRTPLKLDAPARLCRGTLDPVHVTHFEGEGALPLATPRPAEPLSMPSYRVEGQAKAATVITSDQQGTLWHRLVVEADVPAGTGIQIELSVADRRDALAAANRHCFVLGDIDSEPGIPRLGWLDQRSELPMNKGLLERRPQPARTGCFSGLVQNTTSQSRDIAGRYAQLTVTLYGNGQATPSIAAVRLYGERFSLVQNYLPSVLKPPTDPAEKAKEGAAHPLDFYERFVAGFERTLTALEDTVVAAPDLTNPMAAPEAALDWLAGWIGFVLKSGLTTAQRRKMLANGMRLHRRRGTVGGLKLALDLATDGQVTCGGIVVLEDFRMRRVLTTILGADLGATDDPLLAGPVESGNSFVGNTLHIGDGDEVEAGGANLSREQLVEIAALYRAPTDPDDQEAVQAFFESLAWRVTVLVHHELDETALSLIRDIVDQMTPSHVSHRIERASSPLILGLYSLVGIDSFLRPRPDASPIIVDQSVLGEKDHLLNLPSLDPAAEYGGPAL